MVLIEALGRNTKSQNLQKMIAKAVYPTKDSFWVGHDLTNEIIDKALEEITMIEIAHKVVPFCIESMLESAASNIHLCDNKIDDRYLIEDEEPVS